MRLARLIQPLTMLTALGITVGIATAQPADSEGVPSESAASQGEKPPGSTDPKEVLARAQEQLDSMEAAADNIDRMLRAARDDKDVVKVLCLDDKLNQMNVAVRSAAARVGSIQAAADSGNSDRLKHDSAVLGALKDRAGELGVEANQCIGEEGATVNDADLSVNVDPAIPNGEVSSPPPRTVISAPPVAASPTI